MRKPVILDVNPDTEEREWETDFLQRLEAHVVGCGGPRSPGACPLLRGKECPKVTQADGILFRLDLGTEDNRRILETYADKLDIPIMAVVREGDSERYPDVLSKVQSTEHEPGPALLDGFEAEVESELD